MTTKLRVIVADDERPARQFLLTMLRSFEDVDVLGEAKNGHETIKLIEKTQPDLALLDLQMPEMDGLSIVRALRNGKIPLVAFVTAFEEHAVGAFEIEALDYLLKPVDRGRLRQTINRAHERLEQADLAEEEHFELPPPPDESTASQAVHYIERFPVRNREDIYLLPVAHIASVVSEGELMHITTLKKDRHTMNYRLKTLEAKLDPRRFIRLGRGALVNLDAISKITQMPGGSYLVTLTNTQQIRVSRSQSRALRHHLLRL